MATGELRLAMDPDEIDIELRTVDREIIEMLEEGRCTRRHLADTLGYTGEYVYQRVTRLMEHGIVEKIHDGFYELATDGGEPAPEESAADSEPAIVVPESVPERIPDADARRAIAATLELVASNGGAERAEIIDQVAPEHPLGYEDIGPRGAWWRKVIRPALEETCRYENGVGWVQAGE